jgi:hypothetical protein
MRRSFSIALATLALGCSSEEGGTASNSDGGSSAGGASGASGIGGSGGIAPTGCRGDEDCTPPKVCGNGSRSCLEPGTCLASGDCPPGKVCDAASGLCNLGGECGKVEFTRVSPNVMILLDRSGSMDNDAGGQPRWTVAKAAIQTVTESYDALIRFGLATYSACLPGGCAAGSIVVPIAADNAAAINGFLSDKLAEGSRNGQNQTASGVQYLCDSGDPETSTGKSLNALVGESSLQDATRDNAVLLVTDGEESSACVSGGIDGPTGAAALLAQARSVKTFVVGLGVNAASVDAIAQAGGTGQLVSANNQSELTAALDGIAQSLSSCDFVLGSTPPDPSKLNVYFNRDPAGVPEDPTNGWSYDPASNTLRFHGSSCDELQNKQVSSVVVGYGCPGVVPR